MRALELLNGVCARLAKAYPGRTVYIDYVMKGFERPSFLVESVTWNERPFAYGTVWKEAGITVTCFVDMDEYGNCDQAALLALQGEVCALFGGGKLEVGDRMVELTTSSAGSNPGEAYVQLSLAFADGWDRTEQEHPAMGDVEIRHKIS